jgi:hypothetical protein
VLVQFLLVSSDDSLGLYLLLQQMLILLSYHFVVFLVLTDASLQLLVQPFVIRQLLLCLAMEKVHCLVFLHLNDRRLEFSLGKLYLEPLNSKQEFFLLSLQTND